MNCKLSHKLIKDMCGTVSFKKGDSFFRFNKVQILFNDPDYIEAVVKGTEDFYIRLEQTDTGELLPSCSCPKITSFQKECQHIAAVLIYLYEQQKRGSNVDEIMLAETEPNELTEGLLTIFQNDFSRPSQRQIHFEDRKILDVTFYCNLNYLDQKIDITTKVEGEFIQDIHYFLKQLNKGLETKISDALTFNPSHHCFDKGHDEIFNQLSHVIHSEESSLHPEKITIPTSTWVILYPLLLKVPNVKLNFNGHVTRFQFSKEPLPLEFEVYEKESEGFYIRMQGFEHINVFDHYEVIYNNGKLISLPDEDFKRLIELKRLSQLSKTNEIPIPSEQIGFFLEKVVPGLRKIGHVQVSDRLSNQLVKTPLVAKLYLDRVKDRLLAGLEFHYENIMINPLDERGSKADSLLVRDTEAEAEILKLMDDSLFNKTEGGFYLHNEELEYDFLYHTVPKLQKMVQLYATTAVRNRIFRDNLKPQIRVKVKKERVNWLEFKFELTGIADLEIKLVLAALEEKRKYYRLSNGSILSLETREFQEIQNFLKGKSVAFEEFDTGLNIPIADAMEYLDTLEVNPIFMLETSFKQFLEEISHPNQLNFKVPERVVPYIRNYQIAGFKWMKSLASYGFGGILADDMGLGKTLQSITFVLSVLSEIRNQKEPVLIVCPSSLTYNWVNECLKFAPELEVIVMDGNQKERKQIQIEIHDHDVIITSYPLLRRDIEWIEKQSFHTVFFDEAQNFKNPLTQTARAVKRIQAKHRFALTGTPVENSLEELWAIFHVVYPSLFRGLKDFSGLTNTTVARRVRPFLLRRLKEDVITELPEKIELLDSIDLLPEQKKLYAAYLAKLRSDTLKHLDQDTIRKNRIKILAGITRLRQICCHPGLFVDGYKGSSAKFEQLLQIIKDAKQSGRRVLIFSQFTKMLQIIGRELSHQGLSFFYLDGQTPPQDRIEYCNQFNAGFKDYFLISLKAGGTGLNLTGADTVILYDIWWNPAVEQQAADRAYRMGQTKDVQVIKLISKGTIEEKINELQEKKKNLTNEVIQSNDLPSQHLTEEDIKELLMV